MERTAVAVKPVPQTAGDVIKVTWDSFIQIGIVGFGWTFRALPCLLLDPLRARDGVFALTTC
eukprot:1057369-Prymnesium_polylepis.1